MEDVMSLWKSVGKKSVCSSFLRTTDAYLLNSIFKNLTPAPIFLILPIDCFRIFRSFPKCSNVNFHS